jgi:hypothetical protein
MTVCVLAMAFAASVLVPAVTEKARLFTLPTCEED